METVRRGLEAAADGEKPEISCDQSLDSLVHEQVARVIAFLALDRLHKQAAMEVSRRACSLLM